MRQSESETPPVPKWATQGVNPPERSWSWVEVSVWNERMLAALVNGVKGGKWFSLIDKVYRPTTLAAAWERVKANRGAAGVDGQSVAAFAAHAERYLEELARELKEGRYRPQPVKRVEIPKGPKQTRPLGIPAVKDRIVQTAVKMVIEPIFEATFLDTSYGFRPQRSAKEALREVDALIRAGYTHVVDADLQSYFDTISHQRLLERIAERISDGRVLELVDQWLGQDVMSGLERWTPTSGTPQGAVLSPLLANCYLHPLDAHMLARGYRMVRYADDFVVLCTSAVRAQAALHVVRTWVQANGLTLHSDKTHVGDCRIPGQGFDFLGYRFEAGQRRVRKKSRQKLFERIRERTRRTRGDSLTKVIAELNPLLRGWFNYFKHAHRMTFSIVDGFVRRRLRAMLRKQHKRPGQGHTRTDHQRWPNAFFAEHGLFTLTAAHALASQSR
ncbi:MAG: group II intron reverse transcriptase/maturase [Burkholderiales bacterium]